MDEWRKMLSPKNRRNQEDVTERKADEAFRRYKILDTSVIIDGRIYDIAKQALSKAHCLSLTSFYTNFSLSRIRVIA